VVRGEPEEVSGRGIVQEERRLGFPLAAFFADWALVEEAMIRI
jgi:hypothetical protein